MMMKRITLLLILLGLAPALWANIQASLDRNTIYDGDTVTLTITGTGKDMGSEPDLSVLEKDFSILGTSSSRRLQFINGKRSDQHQWQIELDPLRRGTLIVPAIPVGNSATSPLELTVSAPPVVDEPGSNQPVFIKTEIGDTDSPPFVQQQVHYTVRLYYRVPLVEGRFSDLKITDALVERLGEDKQYPTTVNGQRYQVLERRYAIFPEKSGQLTIPATAFTSRVVSASGRRSGSRQMDPVIERFFGNNPFNAGKRIRVRSQPLTLEIRPRPVDYRARHWLPSADLVLRDSWEKAPPEFRVGEPVTRTITLQAKGLESSHLPDISIPDTDNIRLYPEQAVTGNRTDGKWVFGTRKQSIAYVASRPGHVSLPEVRVDWWDTTQQRQRSTVLPSWEINVLPAAGDSNEHNAAAAPQNKAQPREYGIETETTGVDASAASVRAVFRSGKLWLTVGLLILLATALIVYRKSTASRLKMRAKPAAHRARRELQRACEQNNPRAAARALLDWAAGEWPDQPPRNLGALSHRVDAGASEIHELDRALYAAENHSWNGQLLWTRFRQGLHGNKATGPSSSAQALSPLYPD